jgi:hypothetical protein
MNLGQWLGKWAGNWFGAVESDPNAMAGSASLSIGASGTLTNGGTVTPGEMTGSALIAISATATLTDANQQAPVFYFGRRPQINRTRENDEALLVMLGML